MIRQEGPHREGRKVAATKVLYHIVCLIIGIMITALDGLFPSWMDLMAIRVVYSTLENGRMCTEGAEGGKSSFN